MLSRAIKCLQANLILNLLLLTLLFVTGICVVYLITYTQSSTVTAQEVLKKKFNIILKEIDEIKRIEAETLNVVTEYHYLVTKRHAKLEEDDLDIQLYIVTNYPKVPVEVANVIAHKVVNLCNIYNISIPLVMGIMEVESSFNPFAVSKVDARGLMQVMFDVWGKELNLKHRFDLHNIETGIEIGIKVILIYLENSNGDLTKALQKYNGAANGSIFSNKVYKAMERFETFSTKRKGS